MSGTKHFIMINLGSQIAEPLLVTHFVILPHADKELTAGNVEGEVELIYLLIISTQLPASESFCLIIFSSLERGVYVLLDMFVNYGVKCQLKG